MEPQIDELQWTHVEKSQLLAALRRHGAQNLTALCDAVPGRSLIDIRRAIDHYKQRAHLSWAAKRSPDSLREWIEVMVKLCPERAPCIQDLVPRALKYIALFEERAPGSDLDLSALYLYLSQLCCEFPNTTLTDRELLAVNGALERLRQRAHAKDTTLLRAQLRHLFASGAASSLNPLALPPDLLANQTA